MAIKYGKMAVKLSKKINNTPLLVKCVQRLGNCHKTIGDFNKAKQLYKDAEILYSSLGDSVGIAKAHLNQSMILRREAKYSEALKCCLYCLKIFESHHQTKLQAYTYNRIGIIYKHLKQYRKALYYYEKHLNVVKQYDNPSGYYVPLNNIANIYGQLNEYQKSLNYYFQCLEILKDKGNLENIALTNQNMGYTYYKMGELHLALNHFNISLKSYKKSGNNFEMTRTLDGIARVYYDQKNYKQSLIYRLQCLALAKETNNFPLQQTSHDYLVKLYSKLGQPDSAIIHFNHYQRVQDTLFSLEEIKQMAQMAQKYESDKKTHKIELLEKEQQIQTMQHNILLGAILLFGSMIFYFIYVIYHNKRINKLLKLQNARIQWHKKSLNSKNNQLQQANTTKNKLFQIISHDLRSPLASVAGIAQLVPIFLQQNRLDELEEISGELENCVNRVINLTDNLLTWTMNQSGKLPFDPKPLSLNDLINVNMETYKPVAKQKNITLMAQTTDTITVLADDNMLNTIVRNLINNALKFSHEHDLVFVSMVQEDQFAKISVRDTGVGMAPEQLQKIFEVHDNKSQTGTKGEKGNGLGLTLCRDFVQKNNGEIFVESTLGKGTTFTFTIPLAPIQKTQQIDINNAHI